MKKLNPILLLLAILTISSWAEDYIPTDVQRIIDIREDEIRKIDEQYREALEKLKSRYTRDGELERALLIDKLILENISSGSDLPLISVQSNTKIDFQEIKVGARRLHGNYSKFSWIDKSVEGWIFTKLAWKKQPTYEVTFNRRGTVYIVRMEEFNSESRLKATEANRIVKGDYLDKWQWYEVSGAKGDSFTCAGPECLLLAPGFSELHK